MRRLEKSSFANTPLFAQEISLKEQKKITIRQANTTIVSSMNSPLINGNEITIFQPVLVTHSLFSV